MGLKRVSKSVYEITPINTDRSDLSESDSVAAIDPVEARSKLEKASKKKTRVLTLPNVIIAMVSIAVLLGTLAVFLIMLFSGRSSVDNVSGDLRNEVLGRVDVFITNFIKAAPSAARVLGELFRTGYLSIDQANDPAFRDIQLQRMRGIQQGMSNLNIETVSLLSLNNIQNPVMWVAGTDYMGYGDSSNKLHMFQPNADGTLGDPHPLFSDIVFNGTESVLGFYSTFDPNRLELWAAEASALFANGQPLVIDTFSVAILDNAGNPLVTLSTVISFTTVQTMLEGIRLGKSGFVYVTDQSGNLLVNSLGASTATLTANGLGVKKVVDVTDQTLIPESYAARGDFKSGGVKYLYESTEVSGRPGWTVHVVVPEDDFFGDIKRSERTTIIIVVATILVSLIVSVLVSRAIVRPLRQVTSTMDSAANFDLRGHSGDFSLIREISDMQASLLRMQLGLQSFSRYVPVELVRQLLVTNKSAALGVERAHLTLFFLDIRDFTTMVEGMDQSNMIKLLSKFFDMMINIIHKHNGTVDKLIGDAVMAFWGAPIPIDNPSEKACLAALECQRELRNFRKECASQGLPEISARIGLHSGDVVVGNVGSSSRLNYTALGDAVNLASRVEGLNSLFGTDICITAEVVAEANDKFVVRPCDRVSVKGRDAPTDIYELMARETAASDQVRELSTTTREVYEHFVANDIAKASNSVDHALVNYADDTVLRHLATRIGDVKRNPAQGVVLDLRQKGFAGPAAGNAGGV